MPEWFDPHADLDENGTDLNRLRRNLARSMEERLERNYQAATLAIECMRAAKAARDSKTPDR